MKRYERAFPTALRSGVALFFLFALSHLGGCNPVSAPVLVPTVGAGVQWAASSAMSYLLGKAIDGIWDKATGRPDIVELDRRLTIFQEDLSRTHPDLAKPIQVLRSSVTPELTEQQYRALVVKTQEQLLDIERRLKILDEKVKGLDTRVGQTEQDIRSIKTRSSAAEPPGEMTAKEREQIDEFDRLIKRQDAALKRE